MSPKYRLTYINLHGYAEVVRYVFAYADVPYEDVRIEHEDWPELKPKQPFGRIPVLEIDGFKLSESCAIAYYLADQFDLLGKTKLEAARCNMILGSIGDLMSAAREAYQQNTNESKEKFKIEFVPEYLQCLQKQLQANGTSYFVGESLTVADLAIAQVVFDLRMKFANCLDNVQDLKDFTDRVHSIPSIKKWIETRPKTEN